MALVFYVWFAGGDASQPTAYDGFLALGDGLPLFGVPTSLHLLDHRVYDTGVVRLTYAAAAWAE